jgi:hypothetical protein
MLIKTTDKWTAVQAFINTWLKDQTLYCNHCGMLFDKNFFPCCENPQVGSNIDHTMGLIKQNKEMSKMRLNEFASTKKKTMRWGVSIPPKLLHDLEKYLKSTSGDDEKLFNNNKELHQFMRRFPVFKIPEKV